MIDINNINYFFEDNLIVQLEKVLSEEIVPEYNIFAQTKTVIHRDYYDLLSSPDILKYQIICLSKDITYGFIIKRQLINHLIELLKANLSIKQALNILIHTYQVTQIDLIQKKYNYEYFI